MFSGMRHPDRSKAEWRDLVSSRCLPRQRNTKDSSTRDARRRSLGMTFNSWVQHLSNRFSFAPIDICGSVPAPAPKYLQKWQCPPARDRIVCSGIQSSCGRIFQSTCARTAPRCQLQKQSPSPLAFQHTFAPVPPISNGAYQGWQQFFGSSNR